MKKRHFDALKPICPRCSRTINADYPLVADRIEASTDDEIIEGSLVCSNAACRQEYPIIDGIPVLVPDVRSWVQGHQWDMMARRDLAMGSESLIGDCLDPGSPFNISRQHTSIYAADHYGGDTDRNGAKSVMALVDAGLGQLTGPSPPAPGPILDLGCSVGGTSLHLAGHAGGHPVLGVDLSWGMLRIGRDALTDGRITYSLREIGLVYRRITRSVDTTDAALVDFWIADALALPFQPETFSLVVAMNVLDCVASPIQALGAIDGVLTRDGHCILATPFDWSASATPIEGWIGGHSQRGPDGGAPEKRLQALLADGASPLPGLRLARQSVETRPWQVRLHDRCTMEYATDVYVLKRI